MAGLGVHSSPQHPSASQYGDMPYGNHNGTMAAIETPELIAQRVKENGLVSKLVHLLDHSDTDLLYSMLAVARTHLSAGGPKRTRQTFVAVVVASLNLVARIVESKQNTAVEVAVEASAEVDVTEAKVDNDGDKTDAAVDAQEETKEEAKSIEGDAVESEEECKAVNADDAASSEGHDKNDDSPPADGAASAPETETPSASSADGAAPPAPKAVR